MRIYSGRFVVVKNLLAVFCEPQKLKLKRINMVWFCMVALTTVSFPFSSCCQRETNRVEVAADIFFG